MSTIRRSGRSVEKKDYNQETYQKQLHAILEEDRVQQLSDAGIQQIRYSDDSSQTLAAMSSSPPQPSLGNAFSFEKASTPSPARRGSCIPMSSADSPTTSPLRSQSRSQIRAQYTLKQETKQKPEKKKKKKKKKLLNFCGPQTFVSIVTGKEPNQQTFTLHKSLLLHHSSYFRLAFNNPTLMEWQTRTLHLPAIDSNLFSIVVNWFYLQQILPPTHPSSSPSSSPPSSQVSNTQVEEPTLLTLLKLHTLASTLCLPVLQNQILRTLSDYEFSGSLETCITEWKGVAAYAFGKEMRQGVLKEKVLEDLFDVYNILGEVGEEFLKGVFGEAAAGILAMLLGKGKSGQEGEEGVERFLVKEEESEDE